MNILVVGGGGREHTIIKKLKENKSITQIFALPGNGGMAKDATCVNIGATDLDGIVALQRKMRSIMQLLHRMIRWSWVVSTV